MKQKVGQESRGLPAPPASNATYKDAKVLFCVGCEAPSAAPKDQTVVTTDRTRLRPRNNNLFADITIALDRSSPRNYDYQCLLKDPLSRKDFSRVFRFLSLRYFKKKRISNNCLIKYKDFGRRRLTQSQILWPLTRDTDLQGNNRPP